ncbi:MAG: hypothetical protein ACRD3Q_00090 [Terriglobales bacterium]
MDRREFHLSLLKLSAATLNLRGHRRFLEAHPGCAADCAHPRNKPDDILKSLADRGG